jgi:hypothetical protein
MSALDEERSWTPPQRRPYRYRTFPKETRDTLTGTGKAPIDFISQTPSLNSVPQSSLSPISGKNFLLPVPMLSLAMQTRLPGAHRVVRGIPKRTRVHRGADHRAFPPAFGTCIGLPSFTSSANSRLDSLLSAPTRVNS